MAEKLQKVLVEPRIRLNHGRGFAFGPGKADLLEYIEGTGSISGAAKAMGMSYMRAWTIVKSLDRDFAEPLVLKVRGGSVRGGARLSETGRQVVSIYREMEKASLAATRDAGEKLNELLRARAK